MVRARTTARPLAVAGVMATLILWAGCSGSVDLGGAGGHTPGSVLAPSAGVEDLLLDKLEGARAPELQGERWELPPTVRHRALARSLRGSAPRLASGPLRLESDHPDAWIELEPIDRAAVVGELDGPAVVYPESELDSDVMVVLGKNRLEELRVLYSERASAESRYRVRLGPNIAELRENDGTIAAIDIHGRIAIRSLPAYAVDATGARRDVSVALSPERSRHVVSVSLDTTGLSYPVVVDPEWVPGPGWPEETVVALNSMWLVGPPPDTSGTFAHTVSGSIGVMDESSGPVLANEVEIYLDQDVELEGILSCSRVKRDPTAVVQGDAYCNEDDPLNPLGCQAVNLPLGITVPAIPAFQVGEEPYEHPDCNTELVPGAYGHVTFGDSCISLEPGAYDFASLYISAGAALFCKTGAGSCPDCGCEVRIAGRLTTGTGIQIGQEGEAPKLELIVVGENGDPEVLLGPGIAVDIGAESEVHARLYAPNGTVRVGNAVRWQGKLVARDVKLDSQASVVDDWQLTEPDCGQYCQEVMAVGCANGPPDFATCVSECEDALTFGFCQYQWSQLITCSVATTSPIECVDDNPYVANCPYQQDQVNLCEAVCSDPGLDDNNRCTTDYCACAPGNCSTQTSFFHEPVAYGVSCGDGDVCNGSEICDGSGTCLDGTPLSVNDDNECTTDSCDPITGLQHDPVPNGTSCSDGDPCNGIESCDAGGVCQDGTPLTTEDGDPCTKEMCDPETGAVTEVMCPKDMADDPTSPIDPTVANDLFATKQYLFEGQDAIQLLEGGAPLASGTIDADRIAVVRGVVRDPTDSPLPGVKVTVLRHPEYGYTVTQANGWFDIVVNGGGPLTIVLERDGYPVVQRHVRPRWRDWAIAERIVMSPYDPASTDIVLGASAMQVVRGTPVSDQFGSRRATLLIRPGTDAQMIVDGSPVPLASPMAVRATEFTVGRTDPDAMPAELPTTTQYTYALELSVDDAVVAGATSVELTNTDPNVTFPAILYFEDFYGFGVNNPQTTADDNGIDIPVGYYNRASGQWEERTNGRIVEIVAIVDGKATVDLSNDGVADPSLYGAFEVTDEERTKLAAFYPPGTKLWRTPIRHFSPFDCNFAPGDDECSPGEEDCNPGEPDEGGDDDDDDPCETSGSMIECENRILGQALPVTGTPYALHYQSDRVRGRRAPYRLTVPIKGAQPSGQTLLGVAMRVDVAGVRHEEQWTCQSGQTNSIDCSQPYTAEFEWDGYDDEGRLLHGAQEATVRVGYRYYRSFSTAPSFGSWPAGTEQVILPDVNNDGFAWITWGAPQYVAIGGWSNLPVGLGGFSLSEHHVYDPYRQRLYYGDGRRRSAKDTATLIAEFAGGGGASSHVGGGLPAIGSYIDGVAGIDVAPDGTTYFGTRAFGKESIRRIDPDGNIHLVTPVSGGSCTSGPDGGLASATYICHAVDVDVGPDGSIYVAEGDTFKIRRIDPSGVVTTFAGNGTEGDTGDGGPAVDAQIRYPESIAVGPGGDLFILHHAAAAFVWKVRRVSPAGTITTVVGSSPNTAPLPKPAEQLQLKAPYDIDAGQDGSVYIADRDDHVVYRIMPDGNAQVVAGQVGTVGNSGDFGPATSATLNHPTAIKVAPDGTLYIALDLTPGPGTAVNGIRRVTPEGMISVVVGVDVPGCDGFCRIPGPSAAAEPGGFVPAGNLALGPNGDLYTAFNYGMDRIYRVTSPLPGVGLDFVIPSEDGTLGYVFSPTGKHLATRDARIGRDLFTFEYDTAGRLWRVHEHPVSGTMRTTTIQRNVDGDPTKIIAPFGHETAFGALNPDGFAISVAQPGLTAFQFVYSAAAGAEGLMTQFTDPNGNYKEYEFDALGQLTKARTPVTTGTSAFYKELTEPTSPPAGTEQVELTSPTGEVTLYSVTDYGNNDKTRTVQGPDGVTTTTTKSADDASVTTLADGTIITTTHTLESGNRTFGMLAPVSSVKVETGGKTLETTSHRTASVDPLNHLIANTITEYVCINGTGGAALCTGGRKYESVYTKTPREVMRTTPAGRQTITELDADGRAIAVSIVDADPLNGPVLVDASYAYYLGTEPGLLPEHAGLLKTVTLGTAPDDRVYTYAYDADGNLQSVVDALSRTNTFTYDGANRLTKQKFPDLEEVRLQYDSAGNTVVLEQPGAAAALPLSSYHQMDPNEWNLLDAYTPPLVGTSTEPETYTYDDAGRVDFVSFSFGQATFDPLYDTAGRVESIDLNDPSLWTLSYAYVEPPNVHAGKLESITSSRDDLEVSFGYSGALLASVEWASPLATHPELAGAKVSFGYDNELRTQTETILVGTTSHAVSYTYADLDGLLTQAGDLVMTPDDDTGLLVATEISDGAGTLTTTLGYNGFAELKDLTALHDTAGTLYDVSYVRDAAGRIIAKTQTVLSQTKHYGYDYDLAGRLEDVYESTTTACNPLSNCGSPVRSYGYDANGNRTSAPGVAGSITYDAQDRLTSYDGESYTYTAWGTAVATKGTTTSYVYDLLGNLRQVTTGSTTIDYIIDSLGRRVGRKKQGVPSEDRYWIYRDQLNPVAELDANGDLRARFVYGTQGHVPDYMVLYPSEELYRFITDHLGSVHLVVKVSDGSIAQRLDYDEWGNVLTDTAPGFQPFGFAGGLYDPHTALVRFGARDYDASVGRWTAQDPALFAGGDANLYRYTLGDPMNFIDPQGRWYIPPWYASPATALGGGGWRMGHGDRSGHWSLG